MNLRITLNLKIPTDNVLSTFGIAKTKTLVVKIWQNKLVTLFNAVKTFYFDQEGHSSTDI